MAQAKVIALAALVLAASSCGYRFSWQKYRMDAHRTGVTAPDALNVDAALGTLDGALYTAPNGTVYRQGSATYGVASELIAVQPAMKALKEVVGFAPREMVARAPESELSNWWVDCLMDDVAQDAGRKVDVGILNFGGIRTDVPRGNILLDDFVSMFPFKNYLAYVALKGADLQVIFDHIADAHPFVLGGVKLVSDGHRIDTLLVGGRPLDPAKVYGVATVDFLLDGGDGLSVARNALELRMSDQMVIDAVLRHIRSMKAAGQPFEYFTDGRLVYRNTQED